MVPSHEVSRIPKVAIISVLCVVTLSILVTRIAATALELTGLSKGLRPCDSRGDGRELMAKAVEHARDAHGLTEIDDATAEKVKAAVRDV